MTRGAQQPNKQIVDQWGRAIRSGSDRSPSKPLRARYDAAQTTAENARHWANADNLGAGTANNAAVRATLRKRARYECQNNCYAGGMVRTLAWHTIGTGPRLQFLAELDKSIENADAAIEAINELVEWEFSQWAREVRLADKLRTMRMAKCRDGEAFALLTTNSKLRHKIKLDLRLIEADQVANPMAVNSPTHIDGIEFDRHGNPTYYHVLRGHPGEVFSPAFGNPLQTDREDAENVIHLLRRDRPGIVRGIPEITPALPLYAYLRRWTLAAISTAELIAAMTLFLRTNNSHDPQAVDPWQELEVNRGAMVTVPEGWEPFQVDSKQPAPAYEMFSKAIIREIARCLDMPFNVAAGDSSGYNYSSGRLDHQTYYRSINVERNDFELDALDVIFRAWIDEAFLAGVVPQVDNWSHLWFWPENDEIDPQSAATAAKILKEAGLLTDADYFSARQADWRDQYRQLAREKKLRSELGIASAADVTAPAAAAPGANPGTAAPAAEFGGLSRLQWTRNRRAIQDILDQLIAGDSTPARAQIDLESLGLSPEKSQRLIEDATDDGQVQDPEMQVQASGQLTLLASGEPIEVLHASAGESGRLPTFQMTAYSGGLMNHRGIDKPVVVDLATNTIADNSPSLREHDFDRVVGHHTSIVNNGRSIEASGVISGTGEDAREVLSNSKNGFTWQASIGGDMGRLELIGSGQKITVNGREFTGPIYVARGSVVREISFTAVGADLGTHVSIAASASSQGQPIMDFEAWVKSLGLDVATLTPEAKAALQSQYDAKQTPAPVAAAATTSTTPAVATTPVAAAAATTLAASTTQTMTAAADLQSHREAAAQERERIATIDRLCANNAPLQSQAIREGWSAQQTELHVLRASRAQGPAIHVAQSTANWQTLQAAACQSLSLPEVDRQFDAPTLQAAHTMFKGRIGLQELLMECAWQNGFSGRRFRGEERAVLRAAFSSSEASGIFQNVANKFLLASFMAVERTFAAISASRNVDDFKQSSSYRLLGDMKFEEVGNDGELKHGKLDDETFNNQAKSYGKIFTITRKHLINDDLGALEQIPKMIGRGSALKLNEVFWKLFMDNATFFATANSNYAEGADTALSVNGLTALELMFLDQTDHNGDPLAIDPAILLVPNALHVPATVLMQSTEVRDTTASTKAGTKNPHAGKFRVEKSSYLSRSGYTGASVTKHYLLAEPDELPTIEIAYLNGQQNPTVEEVELEADVLGIGFRGYFDFGVAKQEYRGGAAHKGSA